MLSLIFSGCPEEFPEDDIYIKVINDTDKEIVYYSRPVLSSNIDTLLSEKFYWGSLDQIDSASIIQPNSVTLDWFYSGNLKSILEQGWIIYCFFDYDTLKTVPWNRIRDEYIIINRIDFDTWEEFLRSEFTVRITDKNIHTHK
jgi:hypothetical protein